MISAKMLAAKIEDFCCIACLPVQADDEVDNLVQEEAITQYIGILTLPEHLHRIPGVGRWAKFLHAKQQNEGNNKVPIMSAAYLVPHFQVVSAEIFLALATEVIDDAIAADILYQGLHQSIHISIIHISCGDHIRSPACLSHKICVFHEAFLQLHAMWHLQFHLRMQHPYVYTWTSKDNNSAAACALSAW